MAVDLKRSVETVTCDRKGPAGAEAGSPAERVPDAMNIVIVGHVDHGKSTIIGRLLADTNGLPEGKLEEIQERCRRSGKRFEYAFLLDALKDEQEQGITIDAARCHFKTARRHYLIIDAPGHVEFLKNMVTGASRAEAALLVIDASQGIQDNSKRHGYLLSVLGIRQAAVLVNKMDLVGYRRDRYEALVREYARFLASIGTRPAAFVPVSGREGDNIAAPSAAMPWYDGPTVLRVLDEFVSEPQPLDKPFRMPVQGVYRFSEGGDDRRIVAGTVETGSLAVGDRVVFYPSGKESRVKSIEAFGEAPPVQVRAGEAVGFTLEEQVYIRRGEVACRAGEPAPRTGSRLEATVFWLGKAPMVRDKPYVLKLGTAKVGARLVRVREVLDGARLTRSRKDGIHRHDVAHCVLELDAPIAFDERDAIGQTARFVIVDEYEISGGGLVTGMAAPELPGGPRGPVGRQERRRVYRQPGLVLWFTGLSGAGKSTISQGVERALFDGGRLVYRLDGDGLRQGLCRDLGFSERDREENIRRITEVAGLFCDAGLIVLVSCIAPLARLRERARRHIGPDFAEVYVKARLETCIARDPKGLYARALRGEIPDFTGISSPYEEPRSPDLVVDTDRWGEEECVERVVAYVEQRLARMEEDSIS